MQKILKHKKTLLSSLAVPIVFAAVMTVALTRSKYTSRPQEQGDVDLKAFVAEPLLYSGNTLLEPQSVSQTGENEEHLVSYYDIPVSDFRDLKVSVKYSGEARTYTRFKMDLVWYQEKTENGQTVNEIIFHRMPQTTAAENVYDNTSADNWFYFKEVLTSENETVYPALTSISSDPIGDNVVDTVNNTDAPTRVRIYLTVDSVQYNRAEKVWIIEKLPWITD